MSAGTLDSAARDVLGRYSAADHGATLTALGNHGGFSGALLWRLQVGTETYCLRAWPPGNPTAARLDMILGCLRIATGARLRFVPTLATTRGGETWVEHGGRLWELTTW